MTISDSMRQQIRNTFDGFSGNTVYTEKGQRELTMYEAPLIGFADAHDEIFDTFTEDEVIGKGFMKPGEWLSDAKTVISMFLPFTEDVRRSNTDCGQYPSEEWLYARIEGQEFIARFTVAVKKTLESNGISCCIPSNDKRFSLRNTAINGKLHVASAWSERHAAYACGLGTFGITRGLITEKGTAGRFTSIIIDREIPPTRRKYAGVYDYCIRCGACISRCPVNAISLEEGKNNTICSDWMDVMREKFAPRYGCGKCQLGVPCESGIPFKK